MNGLRNLNWLNPDPEVLARALTVARDKAVDSALNALLPPPPPPADTLLTEPVLEVGISTLRGYTEWLPVEENVWLAWTGLRRRDGEDYHGPILPLDRPNATYDGPRECGCSACQATVAPLDRLN